MEPIGGKEFARGDMKTRKQWGMEGHREIIKSVNLRRGDAERSEVHGTSTKGVEHSGKERAQEIRGATAYLGGSATCLRARPPEGTISLKTSPSTTTWPIRRYPHRGTRVAAMEVFLLHPIYL